MRITNIPRLCSSGPSHDCQRLRLAESEHFDNLNLPGQACILIQGNSIVTFSHAFVANQGLCKLTTYSEFLKTIALNSRSPTCLPFLSHSRTKQVPSKFERTWPCFLLSFIGQMRILKTKQTESLTSEDTICNNATSYLMLIQNYCVGVLLQLWTPSHPYKHELHLLLHFWPCSVFALQMLWSLCLDTYLNSWMTINKQGLILDFLHAMGLFNIDIAKLAVGIG